MPWNGWHMSGWHMAGMWFFWILMVVVLVLLLRAALSTTRRPPDAGDSPEAILKRRYASGQINREEYERTLGDLRR